MIILKIKKKLNSQSGVSILFALLAFMVAAMVSITIIAAASSSVKRVYSDREEEQDRLTLISAAQLVRDEMAKTSLSETVTQTVTENADGTKTTDIQAEAAGSGTFAAEMQNAVEYVDTYKTDYNSNDDNQNFLIEASGTDLIMDDVEVSFEMSATDTYQVVFTFSLEGKTGTTYLVMTKPKGSVDHKVDGNVTTDKQTIQWNKDTAVIRGIPE